jgi:hypothetical protein
MAVEGQNIYVYKGDSERVKAVISNAQDSMNPLNLDGTEVIWELYHEPFHKLLLSKTSMDGTIQISSPSEGVAYIDITEADTQSLAAGGNYIHYVKVKDTFGKKQTVTTGKLFIQI